MKLKVLFYIITLFLLCGCAAKGYQISFDGKISENKTQTIRMLLLREGFKEIKIDYPSDTKEITLLGRFKTDVQGNESQSVYVDLVQKNRTGQNQLNIMIYNAYSGSEEPIKTIIFRTADEVEEVLSDELQNHGVIRTEKLIGVPFI